MNAFTEFAKRWPFDRAPVLIGVTCALALIALVAWLGPPTWALLVVALPAGGWGVYALVQYARAGQTPSVVIDIHDASDFADPILAPDGVMRVPLEPGVTYQFHNNMACPRLLITEAVDAIYAAAADEHGLTRSS